MERNKLWLEHNDYELNKDYIEKLLKRFKVHRYNAQINSYGGTDLVVEKGLYKYRIELDTSKCCANIKRGRMIYCSQKTSKEYMPIKKTIELDSIWYDCIKWIAKNSEVD